MFSALIKEINAQYQAVSAAVRTREFWAYFALLSALLGLMIGLAYIATGFDELTRQQALLAIACRAGDAQLLTIIVGGMVFVLLSLFTLGEVVLWFEDSRQARVARRRNYSSKWRPILFVLGALGVGITGFVLLSSWCQ